jgi:hypothetical protein
LWSIYRIQSYINNLNPAHKELYSVIEKILEKAIPMFDMTLTLLRHPDLHPPRILWLDGEGIFYPEEIADHNYEWTEEDDADPERYENWRNARNPIVPEPEKFEPKEIR